MRSDYIDFISAYCDRWCERCAFTSRCSAYAAEAAIAMCGDVVEGLELAVGRPAVPFGPARPADRGWFTEPDEAGVGRDEIDVRERQRRERSARVDNHPVVRTSWAVSMLAYQWLKAHAEPLRRVADPVLSEAVVVATHDAFLVTVKLTRAVDGRDAFDRGEDDDDEGPVQNDWNGSAKVALICLERSIEAWRVIAQASGDEASREIAEQMNALRGDVEEVFPSAHAFVRPGFDEPGR